MRTLRLEISVPFNISLALFASWGVWKIVCGLRVEVAVNHIARKNKRTQWTFSQEEQDKEQMSYFILYESIA